MQFSSVIGQSQAKALLRRMADSERIPHALLLLGAPGSGDLALAVAFAQYVLCQNKQDGDACGQCNQCSKVEKLIHPDLHFSFPTVGTNVTSDSHLADWRTAMAENPYMDVNQWLQRIGAENKQGNINKEECVGIIRKLSLKAFEGSNKILIMWLPEYLGKEGNRLLKLIEEPPDDTMIILVAENQELILNTILSRCQLVKVNRLSDEEVEEGLVTLKNLSSEKARSIAHLAGGDFNEALNIAAQPLKDNSTLFLDWLRKCYQGNGVEMATLTETFAGLGRENQKQFLQYALHFMREYMLLKTTGNDQVRLLPEELKTAQNLSKIIGFGQIERITKLFNDCSFHIERNANQKLLFLDASIQLNKILRA
ncbi:MAG: hypothetical protein K9J37_22045 [Saprospiraceae bacterium]|nr:hypothetical protein [Saprospiraceae bacterium]MCF8252604.1 hypothetical protein [Saprospiraceae bacterium]MCF8282687.1 hypothetical protein [Bacteroidales bacterium]MCF8314190.1 hypothetical protein [Saprospiraceae bacterium]MCF8442956.1 hypothetical protein [Saprospiraceae bacterium]